MPVIGIVELFVLFVVVLIVYGIPIAAVVWAIRTMQRLRSECEAIRNRLEAIERTLQRNSTS